MASKYGNQLYGANPYSSAVRSFAASNLTLSFAYLAKLGVVNTFTGDIPFTPVLDATSYRSRLYMGGLNVPIILDGLAYRSRPYVGEEIVIEVSMEARMYPIRDFFGDIDVAIDIGGGDTIYLGPFWNPDQPQDGLWAPDTAQGGVWTPDAPVAGGWTPLPKEY